MEKKRQNIDNFFKENLSGFELSKKEGNWELLSHLLDEQERKKKNRRWFFLIFCFLIILTSGLLVWMPGKKTKENMDSSTGQSVTPASNDNHSIKNKKDRSIGTIPAGKNEIARDAKNNAEEMNSEKKSLVNEKKNTSHTIAVKKEEAHLADAQNTTNRDSAIIQTAIHIAAQQPNVPLNDSAETGAEQTSHAEFLVANQSQAGDSANASTSAQQESNESLISSDSLITKPVSSDSLGATTKNNSPADSTTNPIPAKTKFLNFNFYAGVNIYSTSSAFTRQENISPIAGMEFSLPVSPKFSIGLAGLYSMQGGYHLEDTVIVTQKTYFLDVNENVSEQAIQIHKLHKIYFPLTLYYAVTKRHFLSGALQLSYLLNTTADYTEKNTTSGITNESRKNNVKGYMDGIKPTGIATSLGYRYRLTKTFDVSAHITRELTEGYMKEYFYGVNTKPSWTFQTFLVLKF